MVVQRRLFELRGVAGSDAELRWGNKWGNMPHRFQPIST